MTLFPFVPGAWHERSFSLVAFSSIVLALAPAAIAQFGPEQIISSQVNAPRDVYAIDIDGDGDADVLSASIIDDKIAWYENLGGGSFGPQQIIASPAGVPWGVYAIDLDGDGDADVLSATAGDNMIKWYENLGGGSFGTERIITTQTAAAKNVYATDLDGDGDADVLSASSSDDKIAWYENLGNASGVFGTQQIITTQADYAVSVYATDLDGDGDADVLSASHYDGKLAWYENLGNASGVFGTQHVLPVACMPNRVYAADLDGDGDADVLSVSTNPSCLSWHENLGGGSFGPQHSIHPAGSGYDVLATDLDGDGDADLLTSTLAWHENLGSGSFGPQQVVMSLGNGKRVHATDLDGDGDMDVLCASTVPGKIAWYENEHFSPGPGTVYCHPAVPNSTGLPGAISAIGSTIVADNDLALTASSLPASSFGLFLTSQTQAMIAQPGGSQGVLCLSGAVGRYVGPGQIQNAGAAGAFSLALDLTQTPTPMGLVTIMAGETWNYTAWHRDAVSGFATSNFTDALSISFQ